jgi:LeuA allosteric (dimerisation) domain
MRSFVPSIRKPLFVRAQDFLKSKVSRFSATQRNRIEQTNPYQSTQLAQFTAPSSPGAQEEPVQLKVLIESSLVIDVLLNRASPFLEDSVTVMEWATNGLLQAYITEGGLEDIWHLTERLQGAESANQLIETLLKSFIVCSVDRSVITESCSLGVSNWESAVLMTCLIRHDLDGIITLRSEEFLGELELFEQQQRWILKPSDFLNWKSGAGAVLPSQLGELKAQLNRRFTLFDVVDPEPKLLIADWRIEDFTVCSSKSPSARATVTVVDSHNQIHERSAQGDGAIDALCRALDQAVSPLFPERSYELRSIQIQNIEYGIESRVASTVMLKDKKRAYHARAVHADSIKAGFYAYVHALEQIYQANQLSQVIPNNAF